MFLSIFHHAGLLQSLILLFEKRLKGTVYRPIGMEWAEKGFWKVYDHPATQAQYLGIGSATPDGTPPLNNVIWEQTTNPSGFRPANGIYHCHDIDSGFSNTAITFSAFMDININIVIASLPQHIEPYKKLCEIHPNKPKLIYQVGNAWDIINSPVKNVMSSAIIPVVPAGTNYIQYHQEFDLKTFSPEFNEPYRIISSFVNCFSIADYMKNDWLTFQEIERMMPEWSFKCLGGQCRDGAAHGSAELAHKMRESKFIWHTKYGGDGYGHVIHNAAAVGRPLIVMKQYYIGKMAEPLLIDGETCIVIDGLSASQIVEKIKYYSEPERYIAMCKGTYENFKRIVDFNREEQEIRSFLSKLI